KLERRKYSDDTIQTVLAELATKKILDDRAFAAGFARHLLYRKRLGRKRAALELRTRGIAEDLVEETLDPLYVEVDEQTLAQTALEKRLHTMNRSSKPSDVRRLADFLRRKGFSYDAIRKALKAEYEIR